MNQLKVFTLKEANDLIPRLTPMLQELRATREVILKLEVEIDTLTSELRALRELRGEISGSILLRFCR